jgi:hypothetical protein
MLVMKGKINMFLSYASWPLGIWGRSFERRRYIALLFPPFFYTNSTSGI